MSKRKCPICGGNFEEGTTTYTVDLDFGLAVVKTSPRVNPKVEFNRFSSPSDGRGSKVGVKLKKEAP